MAQPPHPPYPPHPYPAPPPPPRNGVDLAVSIVALLLTAGMLAVSVVLGIFSLAFLDHCPPATCSVDGAVAAVFTTLLVAFGVALAGLVITVVQLVWRRRGWPFALATIGLVLIVFVIGGFGYSSAVG
ncbi:hypothetical protein [Mycolicibacterium phlei]|uniref:hypothetical protein n=1 Tax=Mycolicibacterium phlei TaxID=1771 RepID=UPI0037C558AE